jgi:hypothetical protein
MRPSNAFYFISIACLFVVGLTPRSTDLDRSLKSPLGLVLSSGNLYVSDARGRKILYRSISTQEFEVFVADSRFQSPSGITADATALYVADPSAHTVFRVDKKSKEVTASSRLSPRRASLRFHSEGSAFPNVRSCR